MNGRGASDMVKVLRFGLMDPLIKDNGVMGKRKATASSCILMAPSMKVTGVMIKPTESVPTPKMMVLFVVVIGSMTSNMVFVSKPHKMENTVVS